MRILKIATKSSISKLLFYCNRLYIKNVNTTIDAAIIYFKSQHRTGNPAVILKSSCGESQIKQQAMSLNIKALSEKFISENMKFANLYKKSCSLDKVLLNKGLKSGKAKQKIVEKDTTSSEKMKLSVIKEWNDEMFSGLVGDYESFMSSSLIASDQLSLTHDKSGLSTTLSNSASSSALQLSKKNSTSFVYEVMQPRLPSRAGNSFNGDEAHNQSKNQFSQDCKNNCQSFINNSSNKTCKQQPTKWREGLRTRLLVDQTIKKFSETKLFTQPK